MQHSDRKVSLTIAGLLFATITGWVGARWADDPLLKAIFDSFHWTTGSACGALFAWKAYRSSGEESREVMRWTWIGMVAYTIGQLVWNVQWVFSWLPFPGPSDALYLSMGFLTSVGLLRVSAALLDKPARRALHLDATTFAVGMLCFCLVLYLPKQGTYTDLQLAMMLLYPVSLIVPATLATMLLLTMQVRITWRVIAFPVFLVLYAGCWINWNSLFLLGQQTDGAWLNLSFSAVFIGIGWSTTQFHLKKSDTEKGVRLSDNIVRFLPMIMVALAALGAILVNQSAAYSENIQTLSLAGAMLVICLAMVRQSYLLRDRDRALAAERIVGEREKELEILNLELEQRVEARTKELVHSQKMAALGSIVAGVAHELNTPIGNVRLVASTLQDEVKLLKNQIEDGQLKKSELLQLLDRATSASTMIEQGLQRASELISSFKQIAVDRSAERQRVFKLEQLISEIVRLQQVALRNRNISIRINVPDSIELDSYPGPIGQILDILIENAFLHGFATNASGTIDIEAESVASGKIKIIVADKGKGIDPKDIEKIFDPFFTTRFGQGGSGLGLHLAWNIVTEILNGTITVKSDPGIGTQFFVEIPRIASESL